MATLFPNVVGDAGFDEYVARSWSGGAVSQHVRETLQDTNDLMSASRALAQAHFGDAATPEHALVLFRELLTEIRHRSLLVRKDTE